MKILFITHYAALYGANKSLLNLIEGFNSLPIEVCVVIPKIGEITKEFEKRNINYVVQEFPWWCGNIKKATGTTFKRIKSFIKRKKQVYEMHQKNLQNVQLLKNELKGFKPDVVFSNSSVFNFGYLFAEKFKIPHVWFLRETQEQYHLKWFYNQRRVQKSINKSDVKIAVSDFLKGYYQYRLGLKDVKVIYNGVISKANLQLLDQRRKDLKCSKSNDLVFGIIGLIHPKKGQIEAIKAFSIVNMSFPETKLIIVGLGDQSHLIKLIQDLNLEENVELWGHIEDPFEAFLNMDVCLMCSRMEGLGRVTIEAMASGLPVIGYKEGGTVDIITENETGLFYENDHRNLAEKMLILIKNERLRNQLGEKAREVFSERYTSEVYAKNVYELIKEYA
jgi:glycosyltransferase involved in cell wall biosynthesis